MKNNHKYFPEDKARKIIERYLESAGISKKAKIEKENDRFKIIFNTQGKHEAIKDALKVSMSLLGFESYEYSFQKYPIIFMHNDEVIVNASELTGHDVIEDICKYLAPHKPRKDSYPQQSMLRFYKGIFHSLLKYKQALMRRQAYHERQNDLNTSCGEYLSSKYSIDILMKASRLARSQTRQKKTISNELFLILLIVSSLGCFAFVEYEKLASALGSCWGAIAIGVAIHKNLIESTLPKKEEISEIINIAIEESKIQEK